MKEAVILDITKKIAQRQQLTSTPHAETIAKIIHLDEERKKRQRRKSLPTIKIIYLKTLAELNDLTKK